MALVALSACTSVDEMFCLCKNMCIDLKINLTSEASTSEESDFTLQSRPLTVEGLV